MNCYKSFSRQKHMRCCVGLVATYRLPGIQISPVSFTAKLHKQQIKAVGIVENQVDQTKNDQQAVRRIAFFDVDGTIAKSNIVWPFVYIQFACLSIFEKIFWIPYFAMMSFVYRAVDKFDRSTFNKMFYENYKGYTRQQQPLMANIAMEKYYKQRIFKGVVSHIKELQQQGYFIVLVTGQLDFIVQELANIIGANDIIANQLEMDENGVFTGKLRGKPVSNAQKQILMNQFAEKHNTDMKSCIAYGDSISDLPMLMSVGTPITVAPDAKLRQLALQNNWKIIESWD
eukprot:TRINITY_DN6806_c0_g1_i1.p2 TRINITY_DN6806_c0_g1~~TRINITY_DN6806_c0_g1_i1.p2  ORF type:complete len:302 (-),score=15.94 TRINITY_DN6806_c0_g1_i1:408-1265(-)